MKITTKEIVVPAPPRTHTLELTDNELAILRYLVDDTPLAHAGVMYSAERFLAQTKTDKEPVITSFSDAFTKSE